MSDPETKTGLEERLESIKAGQTDPKAFFELGNMRTLQQEPERSLAAFACGVYHAENAAQLKDELGRLHRRASEASGTDDPGLAATYWGRKALLLGLAAKFRDESALKAIGKFATKEGRKLDKSIVLIVDSFKDARQVPDQAQRQYVQNAFKDYHGTLISGGMDTTMGRIAGDIQAARPKGILTIAYHPDDLPSGAMLDQRYSEHRRVSDAPCNCHGPLQCWADMLSSGAKPADIKVIGVGNAPDAVLQYTLAVAFGSTVVMSETVRDAGSVDSDDPLLSLLDRIVYYPDYQYLLRTFVGTGLPSFPRQAREKAARALHDSYRTVWSPSRTQETMAEWKKLSPELKDSNIQSVDHVVQKFNEIGYTIELAEGFKIGPVGLTDKEIEILAEMEHDRWVLERLIKGWRQGKGKSFSDLTDPSLRRWSDLGDDVRDINRALVKDLPELLAQLNLNLRRDRPT